MLVVSAIDGTLVGVLADNGFLTEMRTGAAGAIAADLLARPDASTVAIVGAGSQARHQFQALLRVRTIDRVQVVIFAYETGMNQPVALTHPVPP